MSSESYESALDRAAQRCGVESRFWDIFGREHVASVETKRAIVSALGIPAESAESISGALADSDQRDWTRIVAPAIVLTQSLGSITISVTVPQSALGAPVRFCIQLEDGEEVARSLHLSEDSAEDRRVFDKPWLRIPVRLDLDLPLGYHKLTVEAGSLTARGCLIITPDSAWQPDFLHAGGKTAGFAVALYGLRSARNWGFGDFTDLRHLSQWAAKRLGVSFIALNPLHAIGNRRPYNTSPYLPTTLFFQNCLYIDIESIPEWKTSRRAQRCFASPETQTELHMLREAPEVEYERVFQLKQRFLKLLFAEFLRSEWRPDSARAREFRQFQKNAGDLLTRFGLFCALDEHIHRQHPDTWIWTDWPTPFRDPDSKEVRGFAQKHWRSVLFYQWVAWQCATQLEAAQTEAQKSGLSLGLYHDLALATDRFGGDIWAHRDFFAPGCRVGSPPDDFSPGGQDWGFPPPNKFRHAEDGYHLFRESIRRVCQYGGALRIDHVMRFFRLYWIPDGKNATEGAYVQDRCEDLVRILALESVRNRVLIVGEDLGTVEPYIREMLARFGILSYRLLFFERHGDGSYRLPNEYPRQALVSSSTHDLPTLSGFWTGADIEARRAAGVLDDNGHRSQWSDRVREKQRMLDALFRAGLMPDRYSRDANQIPEFDETLHDAVVRFLASTPSMLMLVNQEDLTREKHQQNLPGTTSQYPNWGRKILWTLEQMDTGPHAVELTGQLRRQLEGAGRVPAEHV